MHGERPVRFYASVPIRSRGGITVGTVCAFDDVALELSLAQISLLEDLAREVEVQIEHLETDDPRSVLERIRRALHASVVPGMPAVSVDAVIARPEEDPHAALRRADGAMSSVRSGGGPGPPCEPPGATSASRRGDDRPV